MTGDSGSLLQSLAAALTPALVLAGLLGARDSLRVIRQNTYVHVSRYFWQYLAVPWLLAVALGAAFSIVLGLIGHAFGLAANQTAALTAGILVLVAGTVEARSWLGALAQALYEVRVAGKARRRATALPAVVLSSAVVLVAAAAAAAAASAPSVVLTALAAASGGITVLLAPFALAFVRRELRVRSRVSAGAARASRAPSVVLISIDTLRADRLGAYRGEKGLTPNLDRLANAGIVCETAIAQSSWTLPSVATLLTGLNPSRHGAGPSVNGFDLLARAPLPSGTWTITQAFKSAGYQTLAVVSNPYLALQYGLAPGFDTYENVSIESEVLVALRPALCGPLAAALLGDRLCDSAAAVTRHALARLDQLRPANQCSEHAAPFFLWIHYIDPHAPYGCGGNKTFRGDTLLSSIRGAAPGLGERFEAIARLRGGEIHLTAAEKQQLIALYDASVADLDRHAGRVLERLLDAAGNVRDDLLVVVVSDHGEEFWDHGGVEHGHTFYDELVRVPLIFAGGGLEAGRLGGVVRLTDVAPTVLDLAGIDPPSGLDGATLVSRRDGRTRLAAGGRVAVCESLLFAEEKVALRTERWKYVRWENGKEELYDLAADPRELRDLAGSASLDWARRLLGETAATNGQPPPGSHVDVAAIRSAMERLGYA